MATKQNKHTRLDSAQNPQMTLMQGGGGEPFAVSHSGPSAYLFCT